MSSSPEVIQWDFHDNQLDSAQGLFMDATAAYTRAISESMSAPGYKIAEACIVIGSRAEAVLSTGEYLAEIAYKQDPDGALALAAGALAIHDRKLAEQFFVDSADERVIIKFSSDTPDDFAGSIAKYMSEHPGEPTDNDSAKTFAFAVRKTIADNAKAWIGSYHKVLDALEES